MKRVGIFVETSLASGREILEGISSYVRGRDDWQVTQASEQLGSFSFKYAEKWEGDGAIARITDKKMLHNLQAKALPVVDVLGNFAESPFPVVQCNNQAIGRSIANDFIEKGFFNLAYYGLIEERWSQARGEAFEIESTQSGARYYEMIFQRKDLQKRGMEDWLCRTEKWLRGLPKPVGLCIASDQFAPMVFESARRAGIKIPEEISVIGVDNDAPFCSLCNPALSSLEPDHFQVGYQAALTLDQLMEGRPTKQRVTEVQPGRIHERRSSSELAVADPALAAAMHAIAQRACTGISVDEVAKAAGVSRSVIQRKFRNTLHRSIGESILSAKLRRARELLTETNHSISRVAELSGFNSQEYLTHAVKLHLKTSPGKLRRASRTKSIG
jgi:LacI family transcriptional regulator